MDSFELSASDVALFDAARDVLRRAHHPELHQVAAALRADDGSVHVGIHIGSRRVNVCAESSAIANATLARSGSIETIVATCMDEDGRIIVTNPCGLCRELLGTYGADAMVIVDLEGSVRKVRARDLMPNPWLFPHESDWQVAEPDAKSGSEGGPS
jgi:cytidine deaminase